MFYSRMIFFEKKLWQLFSEMLYCFSYSGHLTFLSQEIFHPLSKFVAKFGKSYKLITWRFSECKKVPSFKRYARYKKWLHRKLFFFKCSTKSSCTTLRYFALFSKYMLIYVFFQKLTILLSVSLITFEFPLFTILQS